MTRERVLFPSNCWCSSLLTYVSAYNVEQPWECLKLCRGLIQPTTSLTVELCRWRKTVMAAPSVNHAKNAGLTFPHEWAFSDASWQCKNPDFADSTPRRQTPPPPTLLFHSAYCQGLSPKTSGWAKIFTELLHRFFACLHSYVCVINYLLLVWLQNCIAVAQIDSSAEGHAVRILW